MADVITKSKYKTKKGSDYQVHYFETSSDQVKHGSMTAEQAINKAMESGGGATVSDTQPDSDHWIKPIGPGEVSGAKFYIDQAYFDGKGYGENAKSIRSGSANSIIEQGVYSTNGSVVTNLPSTADTTYILEVWREGTTVLFQRATGVYGSHVGKVFIRTLTSSSWSAWSEIAKKSDIPTSLPANGGNALTVGGKGIGEIAIVGSAPTDLNTAVTTGTYRMGTSHTNAPTNTSYGTLIVHRGPGDTIMQMAADYASNFLWWRSGNPTNTNGSGAWGAWKRLATTDMTVENSNKLGAVAAANYARLDSRGSFQNGYAVKKHSSSTLTGNDIVCDTYANAIRFYEGGGNARGVYIDIGRCPNSAGYDIIGQIESAKSSVVSGKQEVVNAINDKLGYGSGLTTNHTHADYAWWIRYQIQSMSAASKISLYVNLLARDVVGEHNKNVYTMPATKPYVGCVNQIENGAGYMPVGANDRWILVVSNFSSSRICYTVDGGAKETEWLQNYTHKGTHLEHHFRATFQAVNGFDPSYLRMPNGKSLQRSFGDGYTVMINIYRVKDEFAGRLQVGCENGALYTATYTDAHMNRWTQNI